MTGVPEAPVSSPDTTARIAALEASLARANAALAARDRGAVSVYARGRDYHDVVKGKLKELAGFLAARADADVKVFVDTAPVLEKPLAAAAGLGWQGKHTVLVSREFGNWLFLGTIFTTAALPPDEPEALADALNTLARDPERAKAMGEAGRQRAISDFDWTSIALQTATLYQEVAESTAKPADA